MRVMTSKCEHTDEKMLSEKEAEQNKLYLNKTLGID